jgi:hypothetical protein
MHFAGGEAANVSALPPVHAQTAREINFHGLIPDRVADVISLRLGEVHDVAHATSGIDAKPVSLPDFCIFATMSLWPKSFPSRNDKPEREDAFDP